MDTLNNEPIAEQSWWKRNWKWAVPAGGCGCLIIVVIIAIVFGVFSFKNLLNENDSFNEAFIRAQNSEAVIALLGEPIEKDGLGNYNIKWENSRQYSDLRIPIKGPKGEADLFVYAEIKDDTVDYKILKVVIDDTQEEIDLLEIKSIE